MSKCWYCNNELTSGDNPKHFGICNKCYDEMFKSSDTIIRSFTNKIADLEAKLEESEKRIQAYEEIVEQKDKEIIFAKRDKICIVKQLNDPKAYVLLEDYKELKQQLAEKENQCSECKHLNKKIELNIKNKLMTENCELQKQLTKKEKEIEYYKKQAKKFNNEAQKYYEDAYCNNFHNQDKISFAVEQLEKVKGLIANHTQELWTCENDDIDVVLYEEINNQINELKEGK